MGVNTRSPPACEFAPLSTRADIPDSVRRRPRRSNSCSASIRQQALSLLARHVSGSLDVPHSCERFASVPLPIHHDDEVRASLGGAQKGRFGWATDLPRNVPPLAPALLSNLGCPKRHTQVLGLREPTFDAWQRRVAAGSPIHFHSTGCELFKTRLQAAWLWSPRSPRRPTRNLTTQV